MAISNPKSSSPPPTWMSLPPSPVPSPAPSITKPRPYFPSVNQPTHIDPTRLSAVPPAASDVVGFYDHLARPLEPWDESAELGPPPTPEEAAASALASKDPYLFPRLAKNERSVPSPITRPGRRAYQVHIVIA
jgi:hypothetical protein